MTAVTTHSTAQTEEAAAALSPYLKDGDVLLLHGFWARERLPLSADWCAVWVGMKTRFPAPPLR